jgi:hypothetical protein
LDPDDSHAQIRDILTNYSYDEKGNLTGAKGVGQGEGWEYASEKGWYGKHTSTIIIDYDIILGRALRKTYTEDKHYEYN